MRVRLVGLAVSVLLLSAACGRPDGTSPDLIDPLTSAGESVTVAGDCGSELAGTLRAWAGSAMRSMAIPRAAPVHSTRLISPISVVLAVCPETLTRG
jgi:hypothetical protein